jgi:hypothetical protein
MADEHFVGILALHNHGMKNSDSIQFADLGCNGIGERAGIVAVGVKFHIQVFCHWGIGHAHDSNGRYIPFVGVFQVLKGVFRAAGVGNCQDQIFGSQLADLHDLEEGIGNIFTMQMKLKKNIVCISGRGSGAAIAYDQNMLCVAKKIHGLGRLKSGKWILRTKSLDE